jgi:hypothetical protein
MDGPTRARAHLDARTTAWLIEQRARLRALELEAARMRGELDASERIERAAQRYADRMEEKLAEARKREAALARALGYAEAQRDQLLLRLGEQAPPPPELREHELTPASPAARPTARAR